MYSKLTNIAASLTLLLLPVAVNAQQCNKVTPNLQLIPLKENGLCPNGFYSDSGYCMPNEGQIQSAVRMVNGLCPLQFQPAGDYCLAPFGYSNYVIEMNATSCPRGWLQQQGFCIKECPAFDLQVYGRLMRLGR